MFLAMHVMQIRGTERQEHMALNKVLRAVSMSLVIRLLFQKMERAKSLFLILP